MIDNNINSKLLQNDQKQQYTNGFQKIEIEDTQTIDSFQSNQMANPSLSRQYSKPLSFHLFDSNSMKYEQEVKQSQKIWQQQLFEDQQQQEDYQQYQQFQAKKQNKKIDLTEGVTFMVCPKCQAKGPTDYKHKKCTKYALSWLSLCFIPGIIYLFSPGCQKNHRHVHRCSNCNNEIAQKEPQCGNVKDCWTSQPSKN